MIKKRKYQMWTTKADKELLTLRANGLTYKEIGKIMNRSAISVERRYKRMNNQNNYTCVCIKKVSGKK